ncbi:MAG: FliO/MopB family protein [Asticcacaulis sp.]
MDLMTLLRGVFALVMVLGLILALAWGLRRYAPGLLARVSTPGAKKRLEVVETLVLDPTRRLVLVRLDSRERLILLGEGRELNEPRAQPVKAEPVSSEPPAAPRPRPIQAQPLPVPSRPPVPRNASLRPAASSHPAASQMAKDPNDDLF